MEFLFHTPGIMKVWTWNAALKQNTVHRSSDAQIQTVHEHFMQLFTLCTDSDRKQVFEQECPETGSIFFLEECQRPNCQVSDFF